MARVLLLFVDGVGLGVNDAAVNPLAAAHLPVLCDICGVRAITADASPHSGPHASLVAVDATLGFPGTPQSGTGQAALLTGANTVEMHGGHFGPWVPARLRPFVRAENVLTRALAAGRTAAFANAYPEEVLRLVEDRGQPPADAPARKGRTRRSAFLRAGPPLAALGAGLLTRHTPELERGDAVASELTNDAWRQRLGQHGLPQISAAAAGANLARIAHRHDVTLFAHYSTDYAGHAQDMDASVQALEQLDHFIGGLLSTADDDLVTVIASDHGNIEDVRTGHTRNPALGMVIGRGHKAIARRIRSLTDIAPAILAALARH